jgi:hypothetical protein
MHDRRFHAQPLKFVGGYLVLGNERTVCPS